MRSSFLHEELDNNYSATLILRKISDQALLQRQLTFKLDTPFFTHLSSHFPPHQEIIKLIVKTENKYGDTRKKW